MEAEKENQDENLVDETGQPHAPVDEVDNATGEFGFPPPMTCTMESSIWSLRANAVNGFRCSKLETLVKTFSTQHELDDFSSRVVVVHPLPFLLDHGK